MLYDFALHAARAQDKSTMNISPHPTTADMLSNMAELW